MPIFQKNKDKSTYPSILQVDLHNHLLPGLDDGSPTLEESLKMLKTYADLGYKKVITTPHVVNSWYPNTRERILGQMYHMQDVIVEQGIPIELEATAEYRLEPEFKIKLQSNEVIPFGKENYVLVEMPWNKVDLHLEDYLKDIRDAGFTPILAHPERHNYLEKNDLQHIKETQWLFQLNLLSLLGKYGKPIQKKAEWLCKEGLVDFVGSDAHTNADLEELKKLGKNKYFLLLMEGGMVRNGEL